MVLWYKFPTKHILHFSYFDNSQNDFLKLIYGTTLVFEF